MRVVHSHIAADLFGFLEEDKQATSSRKTIWHFFLFSHNEENHLLIKLEDPRELSIQPYHVINVEHTS